MICTTEPVDQSGSARPEVGDPLEPGVSARPVRDEDDVTVEPTTRLSQLAGKAGQVVISGVDKAVEQRWDRALEVAASTTGPISDRIDEIASAFAREMAAVGAAAGAAAALPGAGAITFVGTTAVDLAWFTGRAADLILAVAAVHGQTEATVEQRRAWILSVLAFGDGASVGFTKLAGEVGKGLGKRTTEKIPMEVIRVVNRALGRTIITKYGTKRGVIALGRALPFGIGALIGGATNYAFARSIARQADSFFRLLPPRLFAMPASSR